MERHGSSLRFRDRASDVTVTVLSPRIVQVTLGGRETAPRYAADRAWAPAPVDLSDHGPGGCP